MSFDALADAGAVDEAASSDNGDSDFPNGLGDDSFESPFAAPFAGWVALADAVAEESVGIANLMLGGAYLARAGLQERVPFMLEALVNRPGIPGDSIPWKRGWSYGRHERAA